MVILVTTTTEPNWTVTSGPGIPRGPHFAYGLGLQKKISSSCCELFVLPDPHCCCGRDHVFFWANLMQDHWPSWQLSAGLAFGVSNPVCVLSAFSTYFTPKKPFAYTSPRLKEISSALAN
uniref:HDC02490 n=1 Tax=Drosophila melanogaster TaxID=7227 RepID=Q6IHJ3_DROME|nr:TPA_inf: HDC02490 [Drosophila melanogaster]